MYQEQLDRGVSRHDVLSLMACIYQFQKSAEVIAATM